MGNAVTSSTTSDSAVILYIVVFFPICESVLRFLLLVDIIGGEKRTSSTIGRCQSLLAGRKDLLHSELIHNLFLQ